MAFSVDDERWPYIAALAWIVSRSTTYTAHMAQFSLVRADDWRACHNAHFGTGLMRASLANVKRELSNALALRKLTGEATRLLRIYKRQNRFNCSLAAETVEAGCAFPPVDDPKLLEQLRDANNASDDALLYQPVTGEAKEFTVTDWRDLTFARGDIRQLWPEHSRAVAYRAAREHPWSGPPQVDQAAIVNLKGLRPSLDAILSTLAPGGDLAERFRAVHWLCDQARDGRVTIYGKPAQPRLHPTGPIEDAGSCAVLAPSDFNDDALTVPACDPPVANALGPSDYSVRFAECVNTGDAVKWYGVTVERKDFEALLLASVPLSLHKRKRAAVLKSFDEIGHEKLAKASQKNRESDVINHAKNFEVTVTDRYVRELWKEWSGRNAHRS